AGQKLGLVGKSGEGKSSLIKILQRFHDINDGNIIFDGQGIKSSKTERICR
ncbi:MAG: ATP-binding cassette domain-containing protein, partial [Proteobacteria bacterium]|nr:ATP-binding cassette domain-containing protein [Pseudomonadota bacterium]